MIFKGYVDNVDYERLIIYNSEPLEMYEVGLNEKEIR